jgi:hypothetical protein
MADIQPINNSLQKLLQYLECHIYKGYDPYDALKSPLFRLPFLRSNKNIRFVSQQLVKRLPFNIRPLLAIREGYNPVTLGLCIQGYSYLASVYSLPVTSSPAPRVPHLAPRSKRPVPPNKYSERVDHLISELKELVSPGYSGACWGYDFPWEARYASIPAYQPTIVATGIIVNALFFANKLNENAECADMIKSAALFVRNDLKRTYKGDKFIFSYSPFDQQQVLNASMKGVRILAQAYSLSGDENLRKEAARGVEFVSSNQRPDGSWPYSLAADGGWTDNYHTGYVLECMDEYSKLCQDKRFDANIRSGYSFYRDNFFTAEGKPGFYAGKEWPVDCTAAAQSIITLCRFGDEKMAEKVALYTIHNMQSSGGGFYYRKYRCRTDKTIFMRWSNAWMFAALARLVYKMNAV